MRMCKGVVYADTDSCIFNDVLPEYEETFK